jgi:2-hydroxy-6-oxonona-2,4-dienedioate hydrolase
LKEIRLENEQLTGGSRLGVVAAEWASSRWIDVDGRLVRYREAGTGLPLVLVHGLGVSADYWVRNGPPIAAAGFRVLAPDLPGFGRTEGPAAGLGVKAQAEAVRRWARSIDLEPAVYLGHSLSCQAILELAVARPEMVRGLIMAAPTGEGSGTRRLLAQARGLFQDLHRESPKLAALVAQAYLRAGPVRVIRTWRLGASHDPMPLLDKVEVPGLVVRGENDPVVTVGFCDQLAEGLGEGRVVVVPGGSHGVIFDSTGAFNAAVIDFLRHIASRAAPDTPPMTAAKVAGRDE